MCSVIIWLFLGIPFYSIFSSGIIPCGHMTLKNVPSGHLTFIQRRMNATLYKRHVPTWVWFIFCFQDTHICYCSELRLLYSIMVVYFYLPACGWLVFRLQIDIEPIILFHHSVLYFMCFTVMFHRCFIDEVMDLFADRIYIYYITKTCLFKYTENFTTKNEIFQIKNSDIFHISAQNIYCGYSLEPPCRGGSNEYPQSIFLSGNKRNNV